MALSRRVTCADLVATLALVVAVGAGTSYAADKVRLPKNSVSAKQIKTNAVRAAEIRSGAVGAAELAPGSVGSGQVADGSLGLHDLSGSARAALSPASVPSGVTVRGLWAAQGDIPDNGAGIGIGVSLPLPAPAPLVPADVLVDGRMEGANLCTGTLAEPTAPAGKVCVYEQPNPSVSNVFVTDGLAPANRFGFVLVVFPSFAYQEVGSGGTWAYTAP